jgi:tetratricopeptide (TPR) repeat protein
MLRRYLPAVLVLCAGLVLYVTTLPRSVLPGDSGELIAASRTLSIAHPPGYPLYLMLGKVLSGVLAFGSMAYRYNLISAILASATLGVFYLILVEICPRRLVAVAVTLALGSLTSFWLQATTAEVYSLNALFTALLLYVAVITRKYGARGFLLLGLVGGLSLSHHLTMIYPLVCALAIMVVGFGFRPKAKTVLLFALFVTLGLSVWLYIPIRAGVGPPLVWGATDTLRGFVSHITAQGYRWRLRQFDVLERGADFLESMRVIGARAGFALVVAGLFGLFAGKERLSVRLSLAALALLFGFHSAMYNIPDIESHVFPSLLGIGILAALGLHRAVELARRLGKWPARVAVVCAFLIMVHNLSSIHPRDDEWFAGDYAEAIQESARRACGDSCIVITSGHLSTFPLFYTSLVTPGGVLMFDIMSSNPSIIGAEARSVNLDECVSRAQETYGKSKIALLGPLPAQVVGVRPLICGMVYTIEEPRAPCRSPHQYEIRGVGQDLREYSSRLLSGSYYLHLARWHGQNGDISGVDENVKRALSVASDDVGTHINGARVQLQYGMGQDALATARAAVDVDPDFFGAHDLLAGILARVGETDSAISEYLKALEGNPSPAGTYSNLANAYISKRDYPNALKYFNKAIESDSTLVNSYLGMGLAYEAMGQNDRALSMFRFGRSIDPNAPPAYHTEASLLLKMGKNEGAREVARQALDKWADDALLLSDMGLYFLRSDVLDSAIVYLERSLERDPSLLSARGNLAVALERKGLDARAAAQYNIYLETAPPGKSRDMAQQALERLGGER